MVLLNNNDEFLSKVSGLFEKTKNKQSVWITFKRCNFKKKLILETLLQKQRKTKKRKLKYQKTVYLRELQMEMKNTAPLFEFSKYFNF
jgi:hypothetical protein